MPTTKDCVFVTVPYTDTRSALIAPAILKSIACRAGRTATTLDLNAIFYHKIKNNPNRNQILGFFREEAWTEEILEEVQLILLDMAQRILEFQPKIVGISVFTYNCRAAAKYLSWMLKKLDPEVVVILGGTGINHHLSGGAPFADELQKQGAIDFYIYGDAEIALFNYLKFNTTNIVGINSINWKQMSNQELEHLPIPDYDDYDFSLYEQPVMLPIVGSRGCVRKCTFCDVHTHWKKFTYRSGQSIFDEMKYLSHKYNIKNFQFSDSLINGNLKEYRVLSKLLAEHNRNLSQCDKLRWTSFFILRPRTQFTEEDWELTSMSGADILAVGIETTNDEARFHLGKKFTNDDIDFALRMAQKHKGIRFSLLFFTGYVTESDSDYDFQLSWWDQQVKYQDVIATVNVGSPLGILENTPLKMNFDELGLVSVGPNPEDWVNPATNNTPAKRVEWNDKVTAHLIKLGFEIIRGADTYYILERMRAIA